MELSPVYGGDPVIVLDGDLAAIRAPAVGQRRRLLETLETFDEDRWSHPTRCEGWSTRDVVVHLDSTNAFWNYSITSGLGGEPTRLLADFDPVSSPDELVGASRGRGSEEVLESFRDSTERLESTLESLQVDDWSRIAEAPPGHLSVGAVMHHALWDSWIHERDILCPQGVATEQVDAEVSACLRYVAGLVPAIGRRSRGAGSGTFAISTEHPELSVVVDVGEHVRVHDGRADPGEVTAADFVLLGEAVSVLEALSERGDLEQDVPEQHAWMLSGLAEVFSTRPS